MKESRQGFNIYRTEKIPGFPTTPEELNIVLANIGK